RRRGYTPASIRNFATTIGVAKRDGIIDVALLEHSVREDLNKVAQRRMAIMDPLKVIITNYPEGQTEMLEAINNPENEADGKREIPFSREIWIDRDDFMVDPPSKYFRLSPGAEVRLKYAYFIKCEDYKTDAEGNVIEIYCTYDPETKSGSGNTRKVKGTLGWVDGGQGVTLEVRLYDRLFNVENPAGEEDFLQSLNEDSLTINDKVIAEPSIKDASPMDLFQFERIGYFIVDKESKGNPVVMNRTVTLRDTWKN
ncbi:MAG: glutamine--tRNA ligase, partial [Cyclobacteriaceae bacterium]|nr:glutamine--tRNA ligase [Cyclobacteriaceae bacterium]